MLAWFERLNRFFPASLKYKLKYIRITRFPTFILGPRFKENHRRIEIDITYECNLKCFNCDRFCKHAPSRERLSLEQIKKFVQESIALKRKWELIDILGGEPTLHPDIFEIIDQLLSYKNNYSPSTIIMLTTNGLGEAVNNILVKIPQEIKIRNTLKTSNIQLFDRINIAPFDLIAAKDVDYSNGCWVIEQCGLGLTPYGYYPCAVGGAIDRVFGFNIGKRKLPHETDSMKDQLKILCKYCGRFNGTMGPVTYTKGKKETSPTWEKILKKYHEQKPALTLY